MLSHSIALMLMTILINVSMVVVAPAGAQQGDPQAESEEGLTTTLKGDSLTAGDTITVSAATTTTGATTDDDNNSASNANTINVTAINQSIVEAITCACVLRTGKRTTTKPMPDDLVFSLCS